jgi:hypothetical protein
MATQDGQEKNQRGRLQTLLSKQRQDNGRGESAMLEKSDTPRLFGDEASKVYTDHTVGPALWAGCFRYIHITFWRQ